MYLAFCSLLSSVFLPFRWVLFLSLCFSPLTIACVYFFFGLFRVSFLFRPFFLLKRCVLNYFQFLAFCIVAAVPFFLSTVFSPSLQKKKTVSLSSTRKRVDTSTHTFFYHYLKLLLFFFFFFSSCRFTSNFRSPCPRNAVVVRVSVGNTAPVPSRSAWRTL